MSFPRYPAYKPSGVEWLGDVPKHWDIRRVRWLCEIRKRIAGDLGHDVLSITQQGIRIKDIESNDGQVSMDYSKYQFVEVGDFAMNHMDLLTGYVDISPVRGVTSPDYRVFTIRDAGTSHDKFLLYLLQMGYKNRIFFAYGQGSSQLGRWRLPTEQFNDLPFPVPPLAEQTRIAEFLNGETGKIDGLVAEQRRLLALLKEKRQAVISHAVTRGLNPHAPLKPSGIEWLGDVPAHWAVKKIKHLVCSIEQGWSPQCEGVPVENESEWGVLKVGCVNGGSFDPSENKLLPPSLEPIPALGIVREDLLISRANTRELVGSAAVAERDYPNLMLCDKLYRLRFNAAAGLPRFVSHYLGSSVVRGEIELGATGASASMLNIPQSTILELTLAVPPLAEQAAIVAHLETETAKFDTLTAEAERAIELLGERRSALISAAVTGQIDVWAA